MRPYIKIIMLLLFPSFVNSQTGRIDRLRAEFNNAPDEPSRFKATSNIYFYYQELNRDSAFYYAEQELLIAKRNHNKIGEGVALVNKSYQFTGLGKYADALTCLQQSFIIAEDAATEKSASWGDYFLTPFRGNNRLLLLSYTHHMYGLLMLNTQNLEQQIFHFKIALKIGLEIKYMPRIQLAYMNLGQSYLEANKPDSALYYEKQAEQIALQSVNGTYYYLGAKDYLGTVEMHLADIYKALKNDSMCLVYYYKALQSTTESNNHITLSRVCSRLFRYHFEKDNKDSALYYALKTLSVLQTLGKIAGTELNLGNSYENVYLGYKLNNQFDSTFKYQGLALIVKDSLAKVKIKNLAEFQKLTYSEQLRLQDLEKEKVIYGSKVRMYFLLAGIGVLLLLAIIFYRNNRQKHKANKVLEKTLTELKSTQSQLIQSEKMASLGELTAGIAHEIQNPLNFVNNFSEVNKEMIAEMKEEIEKGNYDEVKMIAGDIEANEEKINHHGKRADAIVKGMLQHSRTSTGQKELTDINSLCDEYLRLAYHGLRSKDPQDAVHKDFNATLKTDFDPDLSSVKARINIVPQDIGRVLLNLYNNAFYAVNERKKLLADGYEPLVSVATKRAGDKVQIIVSDNGSGIPHNVVDKIFQPFFTTKPAGQGTGLGLSLSYDIIKAHGGEIKVETEVGKGTIFIIQLPIV